MRSSRASTPESKTRVWYTVYSKRRGAVWTLPALHWSVSEAAAAFVPRLRVTYVTSLASACRLGCTMEPPTTYKGTRPSVGGGGYTSVTASMQQRQTACHPVANVKCHSWHRVLKAKLAASASRRALSARCIEREEGGSPRCLLSTSESGKRESRECVAAECGVSGVNTSSCARFFGPWLLVVSVEASCTGRHFRRR